MSKKVQQQVLILRKGIFVSFVDFLSQLTDRTNGVSTAVVHENSAAEIAGENRAQNEFLYFWEQESSCTGGD